MENCFFAVWLSWRARGGFESVCLVSVYKGRWKRFTLCTLDTPKIRLTNTTYHIRLSDSLCMQSKQTHLIQRHLQSRTDRQSGRSRSMSHLPCYIPFEYIYIKSCGVIFVFKGGGRKKNKVTIVFKVLERILVYCKILWLRNYEFWSKWSLIFSPFILFTRCAHQESIYRKGFFIWFWLFYHKWEVGYSHFCMKRITCCPWHWLS
jgi:hypothetical protein